MILNSILLQDRVTRSQTKSAEISRLKPIGTHVRGPLTIEIVRIGKIDGGIECFARAWMNGVQIGFGQDGSVDIERFRIFNPPIMVADPLGPYVRESTVLGITTTQTFREDILEALLQSLEHTIAIAGIAGSAIEPGKEGKTTDTFFPTTGAASPIDGYVGTGGVTDHVTWAAAHDATGEDSGDSATVLIIVSDKLGGAGTGYRAYRSIVHFDTSSIPDTDTISSATFSIFMTQKNDGQSDSVGIVQTHPASDSALANSDYSAGFTVDSDTAAAEATLASMTLSAYNDFTLDATGRGWISKTGITRLGFRYKSDYNSTSGHASPPIGIQSDTRFSSADAAGTTQDPKLVVVHASAARNLGFNRNIMKPRMFGPGNAR